MDKKHNIFDISDIKKQLSKIQRYDIVVVGNNIHRIIEPQKNDNGDWIHISVIKEIIKMLE